MSYSFDGSTQYLYNDNGSLATDYPFTLSAWVKIATFTSNDDILAIGASTNNVGNIQTVSTGAMRAGGNWNGTADSAITTTTGSTGTWLHVAGAFTSSTLRHVLLDGGGKGDDTTERIWTAALDNVIIGAGDIAGGRKLAALIAECAVYGRALSDAEVAQLAAGVNPQDISDLSMYWPLVDSLTPTVGSVTLTNVGSTASDVDHPTIDPPTGGTTAAFLNRTIYFRGMN